MSAGRNLKQAQMVADILNATRAAPRTVTEMVQLTGANKDAARKWMEALEAVGILRRHQRITEAGRTADTWQA